MRSVPALFTGSLLLLGSVWVAGGRTAAGLALVATAAGAAAFGVRIMVAIRVAAPPERTRPLVQTPATEPYSGVPRRRSIT